LAAEELRDLGNGVTFSALIQRNGPWECRPVRYRYRAVAAWEDGLVRRNRHDLDVDEARAAAERPVEGMR
jgi:hypothetical protein